MICLIIVSFHTRIRGLRKKVDQQYIDHDISLYYKFKSTCLFVMSFGQYNGILVNDELK